MSKKRCSACNITLLDKRLLRIAIELEEGAGESGDVVMPILKQLLFVVAISTVFTASVP